MEGRCPNEKDQTNYDLLNEAKYFLLYFKFNMNDFKLEPGTIILKKENVFYFFSPDYQDIYRSVFGEISKTLTTNEETELLYNCFTIENQFQIKNNGTITIKCFLISGIDPDGIPDFTGYLECEDDEGKSTIIKIKDLFKQAGGRHFRSRKRTSKRKTKSRRKKRAF